MNLPSKRKKIKVKSRESKIIDFKEDWMMYSTVFMFFIAMFSMVYFGFKTFIGIVDILKIFVVILSFCVIALFLFFKSAFPMNMMEKLSFIVFGMAPFLCGMLFALNYLIPIDTKVQSYAMTELESHSGRLLFNVDEFPCEDYPELCVIDNITTYLPRKGDTIIISVSTGLFGYKVINYMSLPSPELPD